MVKVNTQQALDLEQWRVAAHQQFAGLVRQNAALGLAVFVLDIANQHFQHVFHGQVAHHLAVRFFHQGKVRAALAEPLQQLRQRHVARYTLQRPGQFFQVEGFGQVLKVGQFQQQVLDMQQAQKRIALGVVDRVAAEFVATEQRQDLLQRGLGVQCHQVFARVGPVDHLQLAHLDSRSQYTHALVAGVLTAAGVQDQLEFFTAVGVIVMSAGFTLAGNPQNGIGAGVEQVDRRVHGPVKQVQRHGRPQRQRFGFSYSPRFWSQFADHNVQVGNDEEGGKERHALDHFGRFDAHGAQYRLQDVGERRFADPAQPQRRQGDTQLAGRKVSVELVVDGAQDLSAPAVHVCDGLDPGRAQFDHGKFRRNEEAVEQNQDQCKKNHAEVGEECGEGQARGRVHDGVLMVPLFQKMGEVRA